MGQKVNPYGFRLGYIKTWHSNWYVKNNYAVIFQQDLAIRNYIDTELSQAAIAKTEITRTADQVKVTVYSAKPGIAIGKKGTGIEKIRNDLKKITNCPLFFNIAEVKRPDSEAKLIAENIAQKHIGVSCTNHLWHYAIGFIGQAHPAQNTGGVAAEFFG